MQITLPSAISYQTLPLIEPNGWSVEDGMYVPMRCLTLPAPQAVLELTKDECKSDEMWLLQKMVSHAPLSANAISGIVKM